MAKKKLNQNVLIELIDLSAGTQQRPLLPETVKHYSDLRKDGTVLPPVELINDGKVYYVWDGFHRIAVATSFGESHIRANVEIGNLRRAKYMSFHANSQHGQPRQSHCLRGIIEQILADKEWCKQSMADIARHVGCSREYVRQVKNKSLAEEESVSTVDTEEDAKDDSKESEEQKKEPTHLKDGAGQLIPDHLAERYMCRAVIQDQINGLDAIKNLVANKIGDGDMAFALLNQNGFIADVKRLRSRLKAAIPFALCPYCEDFAGCGSCHNMGFVNEITWKAAKP